MTWTGFNDVQCGWAFSLVHLGTLAAALLRSWMTMDGNRMQFKHIKASTLETVTSSSDSIFNPECCDFSIRFAFNCPVYPSVPLSWAFLRHPVPRLPILMKPQCNTIAGWPFNGSSMIRKISDLPTSSQIDNFRMWIPCEATSQEA